MKIPHCLAVNWLAASCLAGAITLAGPLPRAATAWAEPPLERFEFTQSHMAVDFRIVLYAPDRATAKKAADAAFDRIAQIDRAMSDYDPQSELSRLSAASPTTSGVAVSDDLWRVLTRAQAIAGDTGGAFDVTVGPVVKLWRRTRRTGELPAAESLAAAREAVGFQSLQLDSKQHTARLLKPHMQLDLGGIAKGYSVDAALAVLKQWGIDRALVAGSGDIGVGAPPPDKPGWRIGIAPLDAKGPPSRYVLLSHAGISTSGDALQHVEIGGRRYSHIVDPHTGMALTDHSSVTVIAPDCTTSDALATGVSVMGPQRGLELIERLPGAAAAIVRRPEGKVETFNSSRFRRFEAPADGGEAVKLED